MSPTERLDYLKDRNPKVSNKIQKALELYKWFIRKTQIPSKDMINWISDKGERDNAFERSGSLKMSFLKFFRL